METDAAYEFEYLIYALDELERYLLSDELFWPVTVRPTSGGTFLKLTLGNVLLSLKKLETLSTARKLTPVQNTELSRIRRSLEGVQRKWQVAWEQRAGREFKSRFGQWGNLMRDIKKDYTKQAAYYQHEVRVRVLLEMLSDHAAGVEGYELAPLDSFLKGMLAESGFIWAPELEAGFPEEAYWFLYGDLSGD